MINTISILDEYLFNSELKKNSEKVMTSHHPSGVSSCKRQLYYKWINEKITDPVQAKDIWRMRVGQWIHEMYAKLLKDAGFDVQSEIEIFYSDSRLVYPIHGYIDNVIILPEGISGIELKTVFGYGAKAIQLSGQPRSQDMDQVKTYLSVRKDFDSMYVPYLARDSFYRTEFNVTMTQKEREEFLEFKVIQKFMAVEKHVAERFIPFRDFHACVKDGELKDSVQHKNIKYKSDWQCMYCQYRSKCYEVELASYEMILPPVFVEGTLETSAE